jgi:lipase
MRLHVLRWGPDTGLPVVCLHGVMGNAARFRRLVETHLADRDVRAFDLRGHGASGWDPPWNLDAFLADVRETFDAEGIAQADLVGFSFGGRLALELAARDPGRVRRLALLDPAIHMDPKVAEAFAEASRQDVSFATADEAVDARMGMLAHASRAEVEEDIAPSLVSGDDGRLRHPVRLSAVVAAYGEMARRPDIPSAHPTLLVRAAEGIVDDRQQELLTAALGVRLSVVDVPGSHSVMWDTLAATGQAVAGHLAA